MLKLALHWQILIAMVVGTAIGLSLNFFAGQVGTPELPKHITTTNFDVDIYSSTNRTDITLADKRKDQTRKYLIDANPQGPVAQAKREEGYIVLSSFDQLQITDPVAYRLYREHGITWATAVGNFSRAVGNLFLQLLKMVSVPLIITSLITGVTGLGDPEELGKLFGRTIIYYVATSFLAIFTGLVMVNVIRPGKGTTPLVQTAETPDIAAEGKGLGEILYEQLLRLIPENPIAAIAQGEFLSIISFSIAFGIFTLLVRGEAGEVIRRFFWAAFAVMMLMTMAIIHLAPIGVLFLILYATATQGIEIFASLGWYMLAVLLGLFVHATFILPTILHFVARRNPWEYIRAMSPALLTAFSSASSNATLPLTMTCVEQRAGISNKISSFVLPLGATVNMDGTALYEAVAVLFIAQMSGVDLSLTQQIIVAVTALLASIGAAGIPHAGLVMMVVILQAVGLPTESQGLIIAVDRILDMARTSVNVWSDACGCAVVARFEPRQIAELSPEEIPQ